MTALGIRIEFERRAVAREPEGRARRQAADVVARLHGRRARRPSGALARYDSRADRRPEHGALQARRASTRSTTACSVLPDGPEREALFREAKQLALAYMPYKFTLHRISTDMMQPLADRLPPPGVLERVVALRRHRRR